MSNEERTILTRAGRYWANPDSFKGEVDPHFIQNSQPEYYRGFAHYSNRLLAVFKSYVKRDWGIIELGCSVGRNLKALEEAGYRSLIGVEVNGRAAGIAADELDHALIINDTIESTMLKPPVTDVIFTQSVLMHLPPESEWVFGRIARSVRKYVIIHEVEEPAGPGEEWKWARNYHEVFESHGMKEVFKQDYGRQVLRMFAWPPQSL